MIIPATIHVALLPSSLVEGMLLFISRVYFTGLTFKYSYVLSYALITRLSVLEYFLGILTNANSLDF